MNAIKPDLKMYFAQMPLIGRYMEHDYEQVNSLEELILLCHKWNDEADISQNPIRKIHFQAGANFVYTLVTGKSFESKNIELLVID